jgi:hypothetical protein
MGSTVAFLRFQRSQPIVSLVEQFQSLILYLLQYWTAAINIAHSPCVNKRHVQGKGDVAQGRAAGPAG